MANLLDKRKGKRVKNQRDKAVKYENSIDLLFEEFYRAKVAEGRTRRTLDSYRENYNFFIGYLDIKGYGRDVRHITPELLRNYMAWMLEEKVKFDGHSFVRDEYKTIGLSPSTVNTRMKTLRTFLRFLKDEDYIEYNPAEKVKKVTEDDENITILTQQQLKLLLSAPDSRRYAGFRDKVLMYFLLDGMFRIGEALAIKKENIDLSAGIVTVPASIAKSRKTRYVPLQKQTLELLKELIEENQDFDSEYIFLSNYGEKIEDSHIRHRFREYADKVDITNVNVHPHLFRHTGATMFLEAGGDLRHLQMLLGHSDLRMVMRYTHLSNKSLKTQHDQYSPLKTLYSGKLNKERKILR